MSILISGTTLTFNDATTQTTAFSSTFGAIGTIAQLGYFGTAIIEPNGTVAGSNLLYSSVAAVLTGSVPNQYLTLTGSGNLISLTAGAAIYGNDTYYKRVGSSYFGSPFSDVFPTGYFTALSGTWRNVGPAVKGRMYYVTVDPEGNSDYYQHVYTVLAIRIS